MKKARKINKSWLPAGRKYLTGGFTMFLALIVMGALVLIAFSVINISVRETELSTYNRESQYAIFAADAGIECALYYDAKLSTGSKFNPAVSGSPITCNGITLTTGAPILSPSPYPVATTAVTRIGGGGSSNRMSIFGFSLNSVLNESGACVIVIVNKPSSGATQINSYGYNTCDTSNPRRVERAIEVTY